MQKARNCNASISCPKPVFTIEFVIVDGLLFPSIYADIMMTIFREKKYGFWFVKITPPAIINIGKINCERARSDWNHGVLQEKNGALCTDALSVCLHLFNGSAMCSIYRAADGSVARACRSRLVSAPIVCFYTATQNRYTHIRTYTSRSVWKWLRTAQPVLSMPCASRANRPVLNSTIQNDNRRWQEAARERRDYDDANMVRFIPYLIVTAIKFKCNMHI